MRVPKCDNIRITKRIRICLVGEIPRGIFMLKFGKEAQTMPYRKVSALEQCWYVFKYWVRHRFRRKK